MNGAQDWRRHAGVDHRGVFSTYTLLTIVVNGSEDNGLHQAFYLNVSECVYCARSSAASIQMARNVAGSSGATATVCNLFINYSALMQELFVLSCVIRRVLQLRLVSSTSTVHTVSAMTGCRPSLTSAGLHPFSFPLHTIYSLREAKWCIQRHPLGVGQQRVSTNCIFLLLFFLSTADLEITRFKIRRQLLSPVCMRTDRSSREIAGTIERALFCVWLTFLCFIFFQVCVLLLDIIPALK